MGKRTHTHRGHCQACGALQAAQLSQSQRLAKHGYTVDGGYFNGVCQASDKLPIEFERTYADGMIVYCNQIAEECDVEIKVIDAGAYVWPSTWVIGEKRDPQGRKDKRGLTVMVPVWIKLEDATIVQREEQKIRYRASMVHKAAYHRDHAAFLRKLIKDFHGKPLVPVAAKREFQVGDLVEVQGKTYEIAKFVQRSSGWRYTRWAQMTTGALYLPRQLTLKSAKVSE